MGRPDHLPPGSRPPTAVPHPTRNQLALFLANIDICGPDECWEWKLCVNDDGYGRVRAGANGSRRLLYAHRLAYAVFRGCDLDGVTVDHICRNRLCCNPAHLRAVSHKENCARGNGCGCHHDADIPF